MHKLSIASIAILLALVVAASFILIVYNPFSSQSNVSSPGGSLPSVGSNNSGSSSVQSTNGTSTANNQPTNSSSLLTTPPPSSGSSDDGVAGSGYDD